MDFGKLRITNCKYYLNGLSYEKVNYFYLDLFNYSDLTHIDLYRNRAVSLMTATKNEIKIQITRNIMTATKNEIKVEITRNIF